MEIAWEATMKFARFFKFINLLQGVAAVSIGGFFIAAGFVLGGEVRPFAAAPQNPAEFGGVERYLVHVSTDKPIYRIGERLYVRGVFLRAGGHTPMTPGLGEPVSFEIKGPKGDTVASGVSAIIDSIAGFSWDIPPTQAGGEYTVRISHPAADGRAERKFDIRAYRAPRLKSQIVFVRDGYGPGDTVAANLHVNRAGREVATFHTEHEGRGRFSFVPAKGEAYSLRITEPAGIKTVFALPAVKASGVVISSTSDITPRLKDVIVRVAATSDGSYLIALSQRGKEIALKPVTLRANQPMDFTIAVPKSLDGVIVATVYDDRMSPVAERLIFRQPQHKLKVEVVPDRTDYVPGDKVTLRVKTGDDTGKPVSAMVGLTVTDSSVIGMIEKREQAPLLPLMLMMINEVEDLADAEV